MATKRTSSPKSHQPKAAPSAQPSPPRTWIWPAAIVAVALVFYWIPLTSDNASIQWDAVDVHYSSQKYFADRVRSAELPFWTPYIYSGFPFLADPQVGAWYPPNWPFFLAGITPRALQMELALHAMIALFGAYLLFLRIVPQRAAALTGALLYAFSGYFAEHSSHIGMFSTAAVFPWVMLAFDRALERDVPRNTILAGLAGGVMILAGHFQNSLYAFIGLGLFAVGRVVQNRAILARAAGALAGIAAVAGLLSAIQTIPGLQLSALSIRSVADYAQSAGRVLHPYGLLTLFLPNATGVFDRPAGSGMTDEQYYLYGSILLIPLAAVGFRNKTWRIPALLLIAIPLWYMLGPAAGLYRIAALLPGLRSVRAPIHFWFVPVLGLALLAAAGASHIFQRWKYNWLPAVAIAVVFVDLFYWNSLANPMAYARSSFSDLYANREQIARDKLAATQPPLTRFDMPPLLTVLGPLNHPLDVRLEASYGYNPLELLAYAEYRQAMQKNTKLRNGLNISRWLDTQTGQLAVNGEVLPRAYFAKSVIAGGSSLPDPTGLVTLDPAVAALVQGSAAAAQPDSQATVAVSSEGEQAYRVKYRAASPGLLKISVPYYPGWQATVDGRPVELLRVDHALMGAVVPPGEKELVIRFRSTTFARGAWISGITLLLCAGALAASRRLIAPRTSQAT